MSNPQNQNLNVNAVATILPLLHSKTCASLASIDVSAHQLSGLPALTSLLALIGLVLALWLAVARAAYGQGRLRAFKMALALAMACVIISTCGGHGCII